MCPRKARRFGRSPEQKQIRFRRANRLRILEERLIEERRNLRARLSPTWSLLNEGPVKNRRRQNLPIAINTREAEIYTYRGAILQRLRKIDEAIKRLKSKNRKFR